VVVHGLRPPALDDLGLAEALRELGGRFRSDSLHVDVAVTDVSGLPAAVEVASYSVVAEALANAAKHAAAAHVAVQVQLRPDALRVQVADDGRGIPADALPGVGLASMRRRAEELGGHLAVTSTPAGTIVAATFPVTP
jgi:signal transduction histidine kinase